MPATASCRFAPNRRPASDDTASQDETPDLDALRAREPGAVRRWLYAERTYVRQVLLHYDAPHEALDALTQEVLFQALRSLPDFRGDAQLRTWLYSIARNVAYAHHRDAQRATAVAPNVLGDTHADRDALHPSSAHEANPQATAIRRENRALVHNALAQLPDHYATIIRLRDLEEKSTAETAEALGLTRVNVRVRLHRARKALRDRLQPVLRPQHARA
jgi:RNA polymerase sigma-70 factor (ECF subfamily)